MRNRQMVFGHLIPDIAFIEQFRYEIENAFALTATVTQYFRTVMLPCKKYLFWHQSGRITFVFTKL